MLELSVPYQRAIVKTKKQYHNLISIWNGKRNLYRSVYHFDIVNGKSDFSNIIINQIFLDFDGENSYNEVLDFIKKLKNDNIRFRVNFSGRGFHIYIGCKHENIDRKSYLKQLHLFIKDKYNLNHVDVSSFGDIRRMRRIENTINIRSNLYCIPLKYEEIITLSFEEIKKIAKNPRAFDVYWIEGNELKLDNIDINNNINEKEISSGNGELKEFDNILPEPCIVRIINLIHPSQEERFLLCLWLSNKFRDDRNINDFNLDELKEKIIEFMRGLNWDDYSEAVNTSKSTRYQVSNIIQKKYNFVPNCKWRKIHKICCSEFC